MPSPGWNKSYFKDRIDPDDPNFRLVEMRLPFDAKGLPGYGPFEYAGAAARERIRRFAAAVLHVYGDISDRQSAEIFRKSHAVDDRRG
jgi:hypothetical protein